MIGPAADQVQAAIRCFAVDGEFEGVQVLGRGHIHDTLLSTWRVGAERRHFVHQRMNDAVFPDLDLLMHNIQRICVHLGEHVANAAAHEVDIEPLRLVETRDGRSFARTSSGAWRTFAYIEGTESTDACESPEQAYEAARAFGWFQAALGDLPASELGETLPKFFDSPHRYAQFEAARAGADAARLDAARSEIAFAEQRRGMVGVIAGRIAAGAIPRRVIHGDTKLNNVLFDQRTKKPRGIVDLDTCMPGYSLYDFGDLVRFTAAKSSEDERDLEKAGTCLELYRALKDGFLSTAGRLLLPEEIERMPFAAQLVTFTVGLRFLADHLDGDRYFKVHRPGQNLDRARVQFAMVEDMERNEAAMR